MDRCTMSDACLCGRCAQRARADELAELKARHAAHCADLQNERDGALKLCELMRSELAELRKDKARLEWALAKFGYTRETIDAAVRVGTGSTCQCKRLNYKCPKCYAEGCLCGGVGCNSCAPQGAY